MNVSQRKSEKNGDEMPKQGRNPGPLGIMGENRRQKYAPEKQSGKKKQRLWDAKKTFFQVQRAKNNSTHD